MGSPALVAKLNGPKMMEVGITDKDQKRVVTNAIRGIKLAAKGPGPGATTSGKRKRADDGDLLNPLIPGDPTLRRGKQAVEYDVSDFDFKESQDIEVRQRVCVETIGLMNSPLIGYSRADGGYESCTVHDRVGVHHLRENGLRQARSVEPR